VEEGEEERSGGSGGGMRQFCEINKSSANDNGCRSVWKQYTDATKTRATRD
jgi:hypothetical protein